MKELLKFIAFRERCQRCCYNKWLEVGGCCIMQKVE